MESHLLVHLLLCAILLFFLLPTGISDLAADRAALLRFSSAVRGRTLRWNQSDPSAPCLWEGVSCNPTINRVISLRVPGDGLAGEIPLNSIGNLTQLQILSLRGNSLSGQLPSDLGSCTELRDLYLQENQFSGEIPASLFGLVNLARLALSGNNFSGEISPEFNNLTSLRNLHLENNQFTGSLPNLNTLSTFRQFNVSFNRLNSSIPSSLSTFPSSSFEGNELCGVPLNPCINEGNRTGTGNGNGNGNKLSAGAIAGIVVGSVIGLFLLFVILFLLWRRFSSERTSRQVQISSTPPSPIKPPQNEFESHYPVTVRDYDVPENGSPARGNNINRSGGEDGLVFFGEAVGGFSLEDLLRASAEVLGRGTTGTTYKAYLENAGGEVIVKRLKKVSVSEGEFREHVEGVGELVHQNLVPLRGYYYGSEEKLLVYDFLPMGSLSAVLHGNRGADRIALTWEIRTAIALQVASGIKYLHSLAPHVTHGNIKSSNILLTDQYDALITEFGITQLVSSSTPNLIGYRAPEVIDTHKMTQKADVYSFGVLLLELLTCKAPTDTLNEEGVDLPRWVQSVVEEKWTVDLFDPELLKYQNIEKQMVQLLHLAIHCASRSPDRRPTMMEVTLEIKKILIEPQDAEEQIPVRNDERYS